MAVRGDLPELFRRAPRREVTDALRAAGFAPRVASVGDSDGGDDAEVVAPAADGDGAGDYEHLLRMPLLALTDERAAKLERQRDEKQAEMAELRTRASSSCGSGSSTPSARGFRSTRGGGGVAM